MATRSPSLISKINAACPVSKPKTQTEAPLSAGKRRLFSVVMWLMPVLFFVVLEGVLRLAGYGDSYPLFKPISGYPAYMAQNRDVGWRYFTRQERVPTSLGDAFKAEKDSSIFRVFVQGGSSAAGYPFYHGGSFSRMLGQRLQQTFPERPIEVVNTAMAAVNSYTLLDFADEIIAQEPDAVLIYAGHNEFYGALGVGSAETLGQNRAMVNLYLGLRNLRIVQGLRAVLAGAGSLFGGRAQGERPGATLMDRMVGEQKIAYGSALYGRGLAQFRGNLRDLMARYRERGIPVFIGTLASNERTHAPFISDLVPGTDAEARKMLYRQAQNAAQQGNLQEALSILDEVIRMDSLAADAFYAKARLLDTGGRYDEARAAYLAAKDRDQLRFRAPEAINQIIREEAERAGVGVVETQAALAQAARNGIIGSDLMMEHLHPNVDGYFLIADAFYKALAEARLIGSWDRVVPTVRARKEVLLTPIDSLYGVYRIRQLMGTWPFQPPGVVVNTMDTVKARNPVEQIALDLYYRKVGWQEATDALRRYYQEQGDYHSALQAALVHIQQYPFLPQPYLAAGNILVLQRRYDEAMTYFTVSNDIEESAMAQRMIGSILLERGDRNKAIEHLTRAVALDPENQQALYNLSGAYALSGQLEQARETVMRLLQLAPEHQDGRRLLASLSAPRE